MFAFKPKFSLKIIFVFIAFTVIGTLTHELGHILVAKTLGYTTTLHYGSMNYNYDESTYQNDVDFIEFNKIVDKFENEIANKQPFVKKERYTVLRKLLVDRYNFSKKDRLLVSVGGPAQTIITALIGLYLLYRRKTITKTIYSKLDWLGIFLSLFILREIFNFAGCIYKYTIYNESNFIADEFVISRLLNLNEWIIPSVLMVLAVLISTYIIFKIVPFKLRFSFIISGLIGGSLGFTIWFGFLGTLLLP